MSALVARAMREPVPFDRDIPGKDRKALEVLVAAGVLKKERREGVTVFAPVVTLAEFRKPKRKRKHAGAYKWSVVHFADGVQALVGSYFGREQEQAIRQRALALGDGFRNPAPECDVPSVTHVEALADYDPELAELCFEQKYVSPGWGIKLTMTPGKLAAWNAGGELCARGLAQFAISIRKELQ